MTESSHLFPFPHEKLRLENQPGGVRLTLPGETVLLSADEALGAASALVEAAAVSGGIDTGDWKRIPVQFLQFEAHKNTAESPRFASIRCWVSAQSRMNAVYVATGWIKDEGWTITNLIEQREVTRADYAGSEDEQYYEQVLTDGEVFVFEIDGVDESEEDGAE